MEKMAVCYCYKHCLLNSHEPSFFLTWYLKAVPLWFCDKISGTLCPSRPHASCLPWWLEFPSIWRCVLCLEKPTAKNIDKDAVILFLRAINLFVKMDVLWKREISWNMLSKIRKVKHTRNKNWVYLTETFRMLLQNDDQV